VFIIGVSLRDYRLQGYRNRIDNAMVRGLKAGQYDPEGRVLCASSISPTSARATLTMWK